MASTYDIVFLIGSGIGNVIEALYAVEHCLAAGVPRVGVYIHKANESFVRYLRSCYGEVILSRPDDLRCRHLIHSFCVEDPVPVTHETYFYIKPDYHSCQYHSEAEQYLSIARALFPSTYRSDILAMLAEDYSGAVKAANVEGKTILYPGGSSLMSARRWPHYPELIELLGEDQILVVGSRDDLDFDSSYVYPSWFARMAPQPVLNRIAVWRVMKKAGLLQSHAHWKGLANRHYAFFDRFSWPELVALFRRCRRFVGNDGGLMHLAGACGASGVVMYGPTSDAKNRPMNSKMKALVKSLPCRPCQFGVGKVSMAKFFINCPYAVECLRTISCENVLAILGDVDGD